MTAPVRPPSGAGSIEVTGLSVDLGSQPVLRSLDLRVPAGGVTAVLGPSGCGKTTLLRAVAGLLRPQAGCIRLGDTLVCSPATWVRPERRNIGLVPQEGALFPHLDVAGNVGFGLPRTARRDAGRIGELLALVGMPDTESMRPHELSGGMQQRVAVARALARRPQVVLLDEPFSALDTGLRDEVRADVVSAIRADGATALLVTHDQDEALGVADRIAVMRDGVIVQEGTPDEVYAAPTDLGVARFVGELVELPASVTSVDPSVRVTVPALGVAELAIPRSPEVTLARPGVLAVRPEDLAFTRAAGGEATTAELGADPASATATVSAVQNHGHDCLIMATLDSGPPITARMLGRSPFAPGDRVRVAITGAAAFFPESQHQVPSSSR